MIPLSYYIKKDSLADKLITLLISGFISAAKLFSFSAKIDNGKVIVTALHKLGDTVFTVPAVKALKRAFGNELTVVCYNESKIIYEIIFDDLKYVVLRKEDFLFSGRIANFSSRKKIRDLKAGTIIDLTGAVNSAALILNNNARKIAGFNERYFKKIYSDFITVRKIPHVMDIYLDAVRLILKIDDSDKLKYFGESINPDGDILIHPFAGWKSKEWSFEKFAELCQLIRKFRKCSIILPGNHAGEEAKSFTVAKNISFIITKDIDSLIKVLKEASIVIGCDSAAVNIASLLGKPTFIIYGPTNPKFHLPYGDHHEYIYKETLLSPKPDEKYGASDAGRREPAYDFMKDISVKEVYERIVSFYQNVFNEKLERI